MANYEFFVTTSPKEKILISSVLINVAVDLFSYPLLCKYLFLYSDALENKRKNGKGIITPKNAHKYSLISK